MGRTLNKKGTPARQAATSRPKAPAPPDAETLESSLQSRLVEAQATLGKDYARLREFESRYRHLFVSTTEALVVIDAQSLRVLDANPAACSLLGVSSQKLVGGSVLSAFHSRAHAAVESLAAEMLHGGQPGPLRVEGAAGTQRFQLGAVLFRQEGAFVLLLRLDVAEARSPRGDRGEPGDDWARYCHAAPDAFVLTDMAGKILQANPAFVELVQVATERQVRGESLGRWLGRTSVDLGVLITNLRQRGALKLFSTQLRSEHGSLTEVEISAALVAFEEQPFLGFTMRDVGRRLVGEPHARNDLSKSVSQLAELVGRVPMREIVANTGALIERMCIEAALHLTRDNRAAAAELLGLSRQSLYVKLRRYGLGDADESAEGGE